MQKVVVKIEIVGVDGERVNPARLSGYILRAVAGVVANNRGMVAAYSAEAVSDEESCDTEKEKGNEPEGI